MKLLDLFCGAGGAAMGYSRAGFEVVGVDIKPQPNYPFEFHQGDALTELRSVTCLAWDGFDAIHASPPCQNYSTLRSLHPDRTYPDLVDPTRLLLEQTGLPWIMENVEGAPLVNAVVLCGSSFGLDIRRHRLFECGGWHPVLEPPCAHHWQRPRFRSLDQRQASLASVVGVHGHLNYPGEKELREQAMGIDWMTTDELAQAIPPAYTEWIGGHLMAHLLEAAA